MRTPLTREIQRQQADHIFDRPFQLGNAGLDCRSRLERDVDPTEVVVRLASMTLRSGHLNRIRGGNRVI